MVTTTFKGAKYTPYLIIYICTNTRPFLCSRLGMTMHILNNNQNYTILMQSCYSKLVTCKLYYITNYLLKLWNCILNIFNHNNYDYMTCKYISTLYKIIID